MAWRAGRRSGRACGLRRQHAVSLGLGLGLGLGIGLGLPGLGVDTNELFATLTWMGLSTPGGQWRSPSVAIAAAAISCAVRVW